MTSLHTRAKPLAPASDPAGHDQLPAPVPPPYEMRLLRTDEDMDAVAGLIARRAEWLAARQLPQPYTGDVAALYREQWVEAIALFEDGGPVGSLRLHREPSLSHWDTDRSEPSLALSLAYSAPGPTPDMTGRLMTLWAQDFAARLGMTWVRCEVNTREPTSDVTLRLLDHLKDTCGWQFVRSCRGVSGQPLILLQLPARAQGGLEALIRCTVPLRPGAPVVAAPEPDR
ncbi:hypothetical protein ACIREO_22960 [Streptomyces sp. NPDC102441]|uniref:hypothetical protein n=1 Tax=Streptomyces sp. NPDC102441 TaxID=3366176 RepID=UPI003829C35F